MRINRRNIIVGICFLLSVVWFIIAGNKELNVVVPVIFAANTGLCFFVILWSREKVLPLFEIGTIYFITVMCYTIIPALQYLASGLTFSVASANQLFYLAPTPEEFGVFLWRYVIFAISFAFFYILFRRTPQVKKIQFNAPGKISTIVFFVLLAVCIGTVWLMKVFYGITLNPVYDPAAMAAANENYMSLSLSGRQVYNNLQSMVFIFKLGVLLLLFTHWKQKCWRYGLWIFLSYVLIEYIFKMGARTELFLTFLCVVILYHHMVKPLKLTVFVFLGLILLTLFFLFGFLRGAATLGDNIAHFSYFFSLHKDKLFSASNEFQALFAGTYDLYYLTKTGIIADIPWQFKLYDVLMLIPQQLLPFEKIDVQAWYVQWNMDLRGFYGYFMFNPIAQSILGLDWVELVLRGGALGAIFASLHRWYRKRTSSFWATLFYLFLVLMSCYSFRSSTFVFVYFILYRFAPFFLGLYFCTIILRSAMKKTQIRTNS